MVDDLQFDLFPYNYARCMNVLESTSDRFAFSSLLKSYFDAKLLKSDERPILTLNQRCLVTLLPRPLIDVRFTSYFGVETMSFNDVVATSYNRRQIDLYFQHFFNAAST